MAGRDDLLVSWSTLTDSIGVPISKYSLSLHSAGLLDVVGWCAVLMCSFMYEWFKIAMAGGTAIIALVVTPDRWVGPLEEWFEKLTAPVYSVFPPVMLAIGALGLTVLMMAVRRTSTMHLGFGGDDFRRILLGFGLVSVVIALMYNPFSLMRNGMDWLLGGVSDLIGDAPDTDVSTIMVDHLIRPVTVAINYGAASMSTDCLDAWSRYMDGKNPGFLSQGCVQSGSDLAGTDSVGITFMAGTVALCYLLLAVIGLWKAAAHVILFMVLLALVPFAVANSVRQHQMFDVPNRMLLSVVGHFVIASVVMAILKAVPLVANGVISSTDQPIFFRLAAMVAVMIAGCVAVWWCSHKHGKLVQVMRADIGASLTSYLGVSPALVNRLDVGQHAEAARRQAMAAWNSAMSRQVSDSTSDTTTTTNMQEGDVTSTTTVIPSTDGERGVAGGPVHTAGRARRAGRPVVASTTTTTSTTTVAGEGGAGGAPGSTGSDGADGAPATPGLPYGPADVHVRVDGADRSVPESHATPATAGSESVDSGADPNDSGHQPSGVAGAATPPESGADRMARALERGADGGADDKAPASTDVSGAPVRTLTRRSRRAAAPPGRSRRVVRLAGRGIPQVTALAGAHKMMERTRWLNKARGVRTPVRIPDTDPSVQVRLPSSGPLVAAAMDLGLGDRA